uniref:Uncharacterized protein n=1 Tax=Alexandrium andersonii TaxID=327968 RepID=A0A7S2IYR5_9DINO
MEAPASRSSSSSSSDRGVVESKSSGRSEQEGSKTLAITPESSQSSQNGAKVSRNSSKASTFGFGGLWSRKSSGRDSTATRSTSSTRSGDPTSSAEAWSASLDEYLQPHAVADATKPRARKARSTGATTRISGAFSYGKRLLPSFRRVQVEVV